MIAEMREGADSRFRAKVATMTRAEVVALHDAECAIVHRAILGGYELPPCAWTLDRIAVLQKRRTSLREASAPEAPRPPPIMVSLETAYGRTVRLRDAVLCF